MNTTKRVIFVAVLLAVLLVVGGTAALAQGGIEYGWLPACITTSGHPAKNIGRIRAIEPGDGCEANETEVVIALLNHNHDERYYTEEELNTSGGGGQVHWDNLVGVPAGLGDGDDDSLGGLACASGQVAEWGGGGWTCGEAGDLSLAGQSCPDGESVTGFDGDGNIICSGDGGGGGDGGDGGDGGGGTGLPTCLQDYLDGLYAPLSCPGEDLTSVDLVGANLSDADLSSADLSYAVLGGANLSGANLSGADLSSTILVGANLTEADLTDADLSGADLSSAILSGADLSGATAEPDPITSVNEYWNGATCPDGSPANFPADQDLPCDFPP